MRTLRLMSLRPFRHIPLVASALLAAGQAPAQTLVELYDAARGYDAAFQSAQANYDAAVSRGEQARAGLLPSAGLSAGISRAYNDLSLPRADSGVTTQQLGINASQPLYRPVNALTFTQGQRQIEIARAALDTAAQDLIVRTSTAYFDVLAAQDTLGVVQAQKQAVSEQRASAQRNFELGNATITDAREAQARYDLVVAQEIGADNDLRTKRAALDQLVGRYGTVPHALDPTARLPRLMPDTPDRWVDEAQAYQPSIRQAQIALEVARLEVRKAEAGHLPTVDVTAGYNVARYPNGTTVIPSVSYRAQQASVGVQLNVPLFAGFSIQNRVRETLSLEEKAVADLDATRRNVAQATRALFFSTLSAAGQVQALEAAEASSQSALEANQLGYQVGVRINIDVLNAQSQLYQTKRDLAQARYNLLLGQIRLRQAAGTLVPQDIHMVDALLATR
ncbi:TolC family outer membrane protein [Sphingomonas sp. NCPPB 2930]